jgi:hypothetical protein
VFHLSNEKEVELQQTVAEKKEAHKESGRKEEHRAEHLKSTENPKGHQFDPSRRTTNK